MYGIEFLLNGKRKMADVEPTTRLLDYLREVEGLCGY